MQIFRHRSCFSGWLFRWWNKFVVLSWQRFSSNFADKCFLFIILEKPEPLPDNTACAVFLQDNVIGLHFLCTFHAMLLRSLSPFLIYKRTCAADFFLIGQESKYWEGLRERQQWNSYCWHGCDSSYSTYTMYLFCVSHVSQATIHRVHILYTYIYILGY